MGNKLATTKPVSMPEPRKTDIKPNNISVNAEGFAWRTILVRAPRDLVQDDLRDPNIWKFVQGSPLNSLRNLDELKVLAFDESWLATATVIEATSDSAALAIHKVQSFKQDQHYQYNDGTNEIYWKGNGYGVRRMSDKIDVSPGAFGTPDQAISELRILRPKVVAG